MRWSRKRQGWNPNCYTFDGEGAKRKETSKDRQPKRQTQAKTDTNKNLEAERKSERGCRVNQQSDLSGCVKTLKRKNAEGCCETEYA